MRYLVTGGTGFIGSNLAFELERQGHEVIVTGTRYHKIKPQFKGLILQPSLIGLNWNRIGHVDGVFHYAAITDCQYQDKDEMFLVNAKSAEAVFKNALANGCKHFVYASSAAVYGMLKVPFKEESVSPMNEYGKAKIWMEKKANELAQSHPDASFVGLRLCNVYGPRENLKGRLATMIYHFAQQMLKGNPRMFKHGEQKRDYIYIKDVIKANVLAIKQNKSFVVNCGNGEVTSFLELVNILNEVMGLNRQADFIDNPFVGNYQNFTQLDMAKAKELLGFTSDFTIRTGIKDYYDSGWLTKPSIE